MVDNNSIFVDENGDSLIAKKQMPSIYAFISPKFNTAIGFVATKVGYTAQVPTKRLSQWRENGGMFHLY